MVKLRCPRCRKTISKDTSCDAIGKRYSCSKCGEILEEIKSYERKIVDFIGAKCGEILEEIKSYQREIVNFIGAMLFGVGILMVIHYFFFYDPTVESNDFYSQGKRIYNLGRMHDRMMGIIVGFGSMATGGLILYLRGFFNLKK